MKRLLVVGLASMLLVGCSKPLTKAELMEITFGVEIDDGMTYEQERALELEDRINKGIAEADRELLMESYLELEYLGQLKDEVKNKVVDSYNQALAHYYNAETGEVDDTIEELLEDINTLKLDDEVNIAEVVSSLDDKKAFEMGKDLLDRYELIKGLDVLNNIGKESAYYEESQQLIKASFEEVYREETDMILDCLYRYKMNEAKYRAEQLHAIYNTSETKAFLDQVLAGIEKFRSGAIDYVYSQFGKSDLGLDELYSIAEGYNDLVPGDERYLPLINEIDNLKRHIYSFIDSGISEIAHSIDTNMIFERFNKLEPGSQSIEDIEELYSILSTYYSDVSFPMAYIERGDVTYYDKIPLLNDTIEMVKTVNQLVLDMEGDVLYFLENSRVDEEILSNLSVNMEKLKAQIDLANEMFNVWVYERESLK